MEERTETLFSRDMQADLSESRTFLMGIAILGVVMYHVRTNSVCPAGVLAGFLDDMAGMGYGGCDIFFFLSGFGIAWSLKKDPCYHRYLGRRAKKLFPAYYPFIVVFIFSLTQLWGISGREILGNLTFLGFWFQWKNQFNWYIQSAMAFYVLAPAAFWVMRKWRGWIAFAILGIVTLILQMIFFGDYRMIAITRVPVFLLGMAFGYREKGSTLWTRGKLAVVSAVFLGGLVFYRMSKPYITWENGLYWYPFVLMAPGFCLLAAALRPYLLRLPGLRWVDGVVCLCGRCSYEIYLVHILFFEFIFAERKGNRFWFSMALAFMALGIVYHYAVTFVMEKLNKKAIRKAKGGEVRG